jgi:hypothetical protein
VKQIELLRKRMEYLKGKFYELETNSENINEAYTEA